MSNKAGCEDPGKSSTSPVILHSRTRPTAGMAGSFSRKIPSGKAGQDVAGEANQVKITHSSKSPGKQTWKGAASGYTSRSVPSYKASPAESGGQETKDAHGRAQQVKGKDGKRRAEAKPAAGRE